MSDTETAAPEHPPTGGKSIALATNTERPRYKSWRKKYRKMRHQFEGTLEENKRLWRDEQKLDGIAKRLREELDGIMEILLDLNQNPTLPASLRYNISLPTHHTAVASIASVVQPDISTSAANQLLSDYESAVRRNQIPNLDLHVIRDQIDRALAAQDVRTLADLEATVNHPKESDNCSLDIKGDDPPGYMQGDQEDQYLLQLDVKLGDPLSIGNDRVKAAALEEKHFVDLTPREVERQVEVDNPQSQHNWLKRHAKLTGGADADDTESLASHDIKPARGGGGKRNLAKQVGDRAVGKAREGFSPSAASHGGDEDDMSFIDDHPQSGGKKRARADPDSTYRIKGGSKPKAKRKRASEDAGSAKKPKLDAGGE